MDSIPVSPRTSRYGCGIYEVGDVENCTERAFITDSGRVMLLGRISGEDLMEVYVWGRLDGQQDTEAALRHMAENLMESGLEIGERIEELRAEKGRQPEDGFGI